MKTAACGPVNPQPPARDVHTIGIRGPAIRNKTCIPCTISAIAQNMQSQKRGSFSETASEQAGMFNISHNYNYAQFAERTNTELENHFLPKMR